jgi:hypothetical protein
MNTEGLTFREWVCAAGWGSLFEHKGSIVKAAPVWNQLTTAWLAGEDPSEYRSCAPKRVEDAR